MPHTWCCWGEMCRHVVPGGVVGQVTPRHDLSLRLMARDGTTIRKFIILQPPFILSTEKQWIRGVIDIHDTLLLRKCHSDSFRVCSIDTLRKTIFLDPLWQLRVFLHTWDNQWGRDPRWEETWLIEIEVLFVWNTYFNIIEMLSYNLPVYRLSLN